MIDPQIALSVRPVQTENALEAFARLQAIKGQQQQQKINALSLLSAQRQMDEEDAVKTAVRSAGGDISKALPAIMQASPKSGIGLSKSLLEQKTAALQQQKAELDIHDRNFKRLGSMAAAVNTREDLNRFLSEGVSMKVLDPQTAQQIAAQGLTTGTMQWLDARTKEAMTLTEQLAQKRFQLDEEMKKASNEREAEKAQREATMFPAQRQKAEAEAALAALKAKGEEPIQPGERERIAATKTAAERAAAEFEERKRHNKAMEAKPTGGVGTPGSQSDAKDIAGAIISGDQPPDLKGLYRLGGPVKAELARQGYDLTTAQRDWQAIQKHLSTLNGPQQERLRQAITFTYDSLDVIEDLFNQWKKEKLAGGVRVLNRGALAFSKQLPGQAGATAQALEAQINDLVSELGTVYKGGNSSTDESLKLASQNLRADWNEETFRKQINLIRKNLQIRRNSITNSSPAGVSAGSPYTPKVAAEPAAPQAGGIPQVGQTFNGGKVLKVERVQ